MFQVGKMRSVLLLVLVICTLMAVSQGSDDADFQTLQTLVQQQAAAISSQQATINSQQAAISILQATVNSQQAAFNSLQAEVTVLKNNVQTLSKPVAFTARFSHDDANDGIPLGPHQTLVFDNVITNAGNGYDPTTGIFRAPLAGYYAFSIVAMEPDGAHPDLGLAIIKNGAEVAQIWLSNAPNVYDEQGSTHSVLHLAAGDQVWIRQEGGGDGVRGSWFTVFTGFLVHVD